MGQTVHDLSNLRIETPPITLRAMALERLRRAIISGVFQPGQRLVERTLCDQLGVSRSVIREVIRHLDSEGLVTTEGQGPVVARLAWDDARQIYEIRAALESAAVEACARVADAEVTARLRAAVGEIEQRAADGDWMAVLTATEQFYDIIFTTGGHSVAGGVSGGVRSSCCSRESGGESGVSRMFVSWIHVLAPSSSTNITATSVDSLRMGWFIAPSPPASGRPSRRGRTPARDGGRGR